MKPCLLAGLIGAGLILGGCAREDDAFDRDVALEIAQTLSSDALAGRGAGTAESADARQVIIARLEALGVEPIGGAFEHPFTYGAFVGPNGENTVPDKPGVNVMGWIEGTSDQDEVLIVSAHYDHLGTVDGEIYNGMDDNASGVVGLLAVAEHFTRRAPEHDVALVFFDAEEDGFGGARAFISSPPIDPETMGFNLNFDMIARGDNGILWASGAHHWPELKPIIEDVAKSAPVSLQMGWDSGDGRDDWTMLSDHMVFFRAGIPHLYLGVEDHPDYHKPTDDFDKIDQDWFLKSVETAVMMAVAADQKLDVIARMRREQGDTE